MLLVSFESNKLLTKNCKLTLWGIFSWQSLFSENYSCGAVQTVILKNAPVCSKVFFFITMTIVRWLKQSLIEISRNFWVTKTSQWASLSNLKSTTTANWMISLAILLSQLQEYVKKKNIPKTWQRFTKVSGNHCSSG